MKNICSVLLTVLITVGLSAQTPLKMSYQAVVRNSSNQLVTNHAVGMKITILKGSSVGTVVYTESQTPNTNDNGMVIIEIGGGTGFDTINWARNTFFTKIESDPTGGTNYTITSTSQLLTVPYALHAKTAENLSGIIVDGSETKIIAGTNVTVSGSGTLSIPYVVNAASGGSSIHYIGELYGGGIIVSVWTVNGVEHGLIASLTDLSSGIAWSNITSTLIGTTAQSPNDGQANTNAIISQLGHTASAAKLCDEYTNPSTGTGIYSDWYLPAIWELNKCYNAAFEVNNILGETNGFQAIASYWSSTEENNGDASNLVFNYGEADEPFKYYLFRVRAVRRF